MVSDSIFFIILGGFLGPHAVCFGVGVVDESLDLINFRIWAELSQQGNVDEEYESRASLHCHNKLYRRWTKNKTAALLPRIWYQP